MWRSVRGSTEVVQLELRTERKHPRDHAVVFIRFEDGTGYYELARPDVDARLLLTEVTQLTIIELLNEMCFIPDPPEEEHRKWIGRLNKKRH